MYASYEISTIGASENMALLKCFMPYRCIMNWWTNGFNIREGQKCIINTQITSLIFRPPHTIRRLTLTDLRVPPVGTKEWSNTKMSRALILSQSMLHTASRRPRVSASGTFLSSSAQSWVNSSAELYRNNIRNIKSISTGCLVMFITALCLVIDIFFCLVHYACVCVYYMDDDMYIDSVNDHECFDLRFEYIYLNKFQ